MKLYLQNFLALLLTLIVVGNVSAQSDLQSNERAIVKFDLNLAKIRNSELMKGMDLQKMLAQNGTEMPDGVDFTKISRVWGAVQAPESVAEAAGMQSLGDTEDLPIEFFVRVEFDDVSAISGFVKKMKEDNGGTEEFNGKTMYSPPSGPGNIRAYLVNDNALDMGTVKYLKRKDRNVTTENLEKLWKQLPGDNAIRLSVDIKSVQGMVDEALEMARKDAPPEAYGFIEIAANMASLSLAIDLDSDDMITLLSNGRDSEGTENVKSGIDGLLGMARMFGGQGVKEAPITDDMKNVAKDFLNSLKATSEGETVAVRIPKPAGMNKAVKGMLKELGMGGDE